MTYLKLILLGVIIGSNNLAAALALGALGQKNRLGRILLVFGFFEFFIPLLGIWLGQSIAEAIAREMTWISVLLLVGLGLWMVISGVRKSSQREKWAERITKWSGLIILAAGLSIDNLIIGFSLGLGGAPPLLIASVIVVFSLAFTWLGLHLGSTSRKHWEQYAEVGAGVLLLLLGMAKWVGWI